jgi:hypothetical protein
MEVFILDAGQGLEAEVVDDQEIDLGQFGELSF